MNIKLRLETPANYRAVEELTREAFWINTDCRPYIDEHFLVHKLRRSKAFVPELDYVAEVDGRLVGNIMYARSKVVTPEATEHEVLTFGPLSVLPEFQNKGIGRALMLATFEKARELGFTAIVIFGHPDYYPRLGFRQAGEFGLTTSGGNTYPPFMAMELIGGALSGISGRFYEAEAYDNLPQEEVLAFDAGFPVKTPRSKVPIALLLDRLTGEARESLRTLKLTYLGDLMRFAEDEVFSLPGMDTKNLATIKSTLKEHGRLWGK